MSVASALTRGRAAAEALMVDACVVTRVTGTTTDPDTGEVTATVATVYTGKCRMQQQASIARPDDVGEAYVLQQPFVLQLPMVGSEGVQAGDRVQITASVDADLTGARRWWVRGLAHKTHATARRLGLEEVTS